MNPFKRVCVAQGAETDKQGCTDHPAFPKRMAEYFIADCDTKDFDAFKFETKNPREKTSSRARSRSCATTRTPSRPPGAPCSSWTRTGG